MNKGAFAVGRLLIRQTLACSGLSIAEREYDVVLCAVSWESRCTFAMHALGVKIPKLYALRFETTDRETYSKKGKFVDEFRAISDEFQEVQLERSISYAQNFRKLDEFLAKRTVELGRPLRVLCDITCIPKSYLLVLLGLGFEKRYFARFDCVYSEGDYEAISQQKKAARIVGTEQGPISEGKWDSLAVPFFEASSPIPSSRDVLVTLGGEMGLAVPLIEKYEPMRLGLVAIADAKIGDTEALCELEREPNVVRRDISVCDVVRVARHAVEFCEKSKAEVVTALAVGSKPHALGLGIAALYETKMEVICRIPKRYTMLDVLPIGTVALFEIEDRFEPHAYLRDSK